MDSQDEYTRLALLALAGLGQAPPLTLPGPTPTIDISAPTPSPTSGSGLATSPPQSLPQLLGQSFNTVQTTPPSDTGKFLGMTGTDWMKVLGVLAAPIRVGSPYSIQQGGGLHPFASLVPMATLMEQRSAGEQEQARRQALSALIASGSRAIANARTPVEAEQLRQLYLGQAGALIPDVAIAGSRGGGGGHATGIPENTPQGVGGFLSAWSQSRIDQANRQAAALRQQQLLQQPTTMGDLLAASAGSADTLTAAQNSQVLDQLRSEGRLMGPAQFNLDQARQYTQGFKTPDFPQALTNIKVENGKLAFERMQPSTQDALIAATIQQMQQTPEKTLDVLAQMQPPTVGPGGAAIIPKRFPPQPFAQPTWANQNLREIVPSNAAVLPGPGATGQTVGPVEPLYVNPGKETATLEKRYNVNGTLVDAQGNVVYQGAPKTNQKLSEKDKDALALLPRFRLLTTDPERDQLSRDMIENMPPGQRAAAERAYGLARQEWTDLQTRAQSPAASPSVDPLDGKTATGPGGKKVIRRNGQWVPYNGR